LPNEEQTLILVSTGDKPITFQENRFKIRTDFVCLYVCIQAISNTTKWTFFKFCTHLSPTGDGMIRFTEKCLYRELRFWMFVCLCAVYLKVLHIYLPTM